MKTTSKKIKKWRRPHKILKNEDDLKKGGKWRRPLKKLKKNWRRPLYNTTTKTKLAQLEKNQDWLAVTYKLT